MKTLTSIFNVGTAVVLMVAFGHVKAQTAVEYLNKVPKFKDSVCTCSQEIRSGYAQSIADLKSKVSEDAENRKDAMDAYMQGNKGNMEDAMMKQAADRSGMSIEEMQKLKDKGDMTDEEKEALANKILQNQNMSLDELKNVQNMTPEGQKAWTQAVATEQMANAQANPGQYKKMEQQNKQAFDAQSLMQEQQATQNKIKNYETEVINKMQMLQNEMDKEKAPLDAELKKLETELRNIRSIYDCNECPEPPKADIEHWNAIVRKIQNLKKSYLAICEKYTPKLRDYYKWYKESLISNLPLYNRAEELVIQSTAATTNTSLSLPENAKGYYSLQAVEHYLGSIDLFKFRPDLNTSILALDFYK